MRLDFWTKITMCPLLYLKLDRVCHNNSNQAQNKPVNLLMSHTLCFTSLSVLYVNMKEFFKQLRKYGLIGSRRIKTINCEHATYLGLLGHVCTYAICFIYHVLV